MKDTTKIYDEHWALEQAVETAKKSNCQSKRGVVIWSRVSGLVAQGWNAPPKPFQCYSTTACRETCSKTAIHAEQAALIKCIEDPFSLNGCEMLHVKIFGGGAVYSEKPSCWQCSKLILASELKYMWLYQKEGLVKYTPLEFHLQTLNNNDLNYTL